jgi:hypothetical protein
MWTNLLNCSTFDGQYFADLFTVDYAQVYEIENPYGQDALQITPFIAPTYQVSHHHFKRDAKNKNEHKHTKSK